MSQFFRRWRAQRAGYHVGLSGRSHNEISVELNEVDSWMAGWVIGHAKWMFRG